MYDSSVSPEERHSHTHIHTHTHTHSERQHTPPTVPLYIMAAAPNPLAQYTNLTSLKGKVVMITGASAGIGEACAWRFAAEGTVPVTCLVWYW